MSKINNYNELLAERHRLENQIAEQKEVLKLEFTILKEKLEPFLNLLPALNILRDKETSRPLISKISSLGIDLMGQTFLSKTGWLTKFIVPLIVKGISANMIRKFKIRNTTNEVTKIDI